MLVTFGLKILVQFPSDPCFIRQFPWFLLWYIFSVYRHFFLLLWNWLACVQCMNEEVGKGHIGDKFFFRCTCKIILALDLLRQSEVRCWVPVWIQVSKGTGGLISVDNLLVWLHNHNYDWIVNPYRHVKNNFIYFLCHELGQICKYNQVLPP